MKIYLFDNEQSHVRFRPLSLVRPLAAFRCGILSIKEKWEYDLKSECDFYPVEYLREYFCKETPDSNAISLFISGTLLPDSASVEAVKSLAPGEALTVNGEMMAFCGSLEEWRKKAWREIRYGGSIEKLEFIFDLFLKNYVEIEKDFARITAGRRSLPLPACVKVCDNKASAEKSPQIFIEEGAVVECSSININDGSIYIGKNAILMEGSAVRGPLAICEGAEVRMGSKIYGGTTIGPYSKVGGEIDNTVIFGYSNKAHDGYLGNAVIGEWCNIGAGVNASNLKNDYSLIRVWNYESRSFMKTDLQFCGLIMGDHSKIGINCMLNTATVMGVGVNLHGCGFPRTYLPSFHDGSPGSGFKKVTFKKFLEMAERMMSRRGIEMTSAEKKIFEEIYEKFA